MKLTVHYQQRRIFEVWDHAIQFPAHDKFLQLHTFDETADELHFHVNAFLHEHVNEDHPAQKWNLNEKRLV